MRTKMITAAGACAAAAIVMAPVPAHAASPAPSCLTTTLDDDGGKDELWVWNTCKTAQRYKVKLANGADMPCRYKRPNTGYDKYWWNWPRRFDGLVTC